MDIVKRWWFWFIIGIVVIAFFFPKPSGDGGRLGVQPLPQTWNDKECSCFGFEKEYSKKGPGYNNFCFGITLSCECTESTLVQEGEPIITNKIDC